MQKIILLIGLTVFALWNWWFLQRAALDAWSNPRKRLLIRVILALVIMVFFFWPIPMVRLIRKPGVPMELALLGCYVMQVLGLWHGCVGLLISAWSWLVPERLRIRPWKQSVICFATVLLLAIVGFWQAGHPQVKRHELSLPGVPESADGYSVMLLSDLHLTHFYREGILDAVERAIVSEEPDLIVHCGDLLDGPMSGDVDFLSSRLSAWSAPDGKYAVFGNHDGYGGINRSAPVHEKCGFEVLSETRSLRQVSPQPWLTLIGVDDPMIFMRPHFSRGATEQGGIAYKDRKSASAYVVSALPAPVQENVNVILCHQPSLAHQIPAGYDLMLSGHTHGGQLFPFNFVVNLVNGFRTSHWYSLKTRMLLYICRGTGFWGPPFRLFVPSEITIITFHSSK